MGFNPATTVGEDFWRYWSDEDGFDRDAFMDDYLKLRRLRGARPRIPAIADAFPQGWCLETNICSTPTRKAADLARADRRTAVFELLFETIKPRLVLVHSNQPILFFREVTGCGDFDQVAKCAAWKGHRFLLSGRRGPIWRMKIADARAWGHEGAKLLPGAMVAGRGQPHGYAEAEI